MGDQKINDGKLIIDDAGKITPALSGFAEMYLYENVTSTVIDAQDQWHLGLGFSAGDLDGWTFDAGATGPIASFADYSGTVANAILATDVGHGLSTGNIVSITGTSAPNDYSGVYEITVVDADTFYFINPGWNATTTGTWIRGSSLIAGANSEGTYKVTSSGSYQGASNNDIFDWKIWVNDTEQIKTESRASSLLNTEWNEIGGGGFATIVAGDIITGGVKNLSGSGNVTARYGNINLHRL